MGRHAHRRQFSVGAAVDAAAGPAEGKYVTSVTFDAPGTYVLRARADDGALFGDEDLTVTVTRSSKFKVQSSKFKVKASCSVPQLLSENQFFSFTRQPLSSNTGSVRSYGTALLFRLFCTSPRSFGP